MSNVITTPQGIDEAHHKDMIDYLKHAAQDEAAQLAISQAGGGAFGDVTPIEDGPDLGAPPIPVARRD